jgi:tetratricopeptide (TPR) repeat protein
MQSKYHPKPFHIFLSFTYEDRVFRDALDKHLSAFQRTGLIDDWHKHEIPPGSEWQDVVDEQLDQADIILLFITPDFVASNYCYSVQMKQALEKHDAGKVRVIPILFRPTFWYDLPFAKLQGLPTSGNKTVSEWRNKDRAYVEIVEGIKRAIEDLATQSTNQTVPSTFAPSTLWSVPYKRNRFFTGRDELLRSLRETFTSDRDASIHTHAISGLGGIGKTQIALEYAYRYRNDYHAIFWLKGDTPEGLLTDFMQLASMFNLPERNEADQHTVITAIKYALSQTPQWLLIIDNLDTFEQLDDLIPTQGQGDILITTHRQAIGAIARLNKVHTMPLDEGTLFLLRRANVIAQDSSLDTLPATVVEDARDICRRVDGLPLALDQAGAYIEETQIGVPGYIALYEKHETALLKQRSKFVTGHPTSIATTLSLCIAHVKQHDPAFLDLLSFCAFLHPDAIPIEIFSIGSSDLGPSLQALLSNEFALNNALGTLLDLSLLHRNSDMGTISIHRLVQVILRDKMQADTQRLWAERAIKVLCRLFPEAELGVWQQCQQYLPHALAAADLISRWDLSSPEAAQLLYLTSRYLYDISSYADARKLCEQAYLIDEQIHGNQHAETARTLHCLGNIDESLGDYTHAQHHYEQAMTIGEHVWGLEHPDTARLLNDVGEHFQTLGQFSLAEDYYRRAYAIRQKIFGLEHPETANSLNNIAGICEEQGRHVEAEPLYEQALLLRERLRGPNHIDTAENFSNIARFYRVVGKYSQAQPFYQRATLAYEEALGPEHPRVATCCNNFAVFRIAMGQYAQAEELLTRTLEIRTKLLGPHHPDTAGSWNHLARVYCKQGRYEQAKILYKQALNVCEQKLGRQHPSTTSILINTSEFYLLQGDTTKAETILVEALTSITKEQGPRQLQAASAHNLLGEVYLARAEYERAERSLTEALVIRQEVLGKTHPEMAMSLKSLGDLAFVRNEIAQAETLYRQALEIVLAPLGTNHPDVIVLVDLLVNLLQKLGRSDDAQIISEKIRMPPSA